MRSTQQPPMSATSGQVEQIDVVENPDGIYVAYSKNRPELKAEGATADEAEQNLIDFLASPYDSGEGHHRLDIAVDPDEVPEPEDD
jgi:hypothetical protein